MKKLILLLILFLSTSTLSKELTKEQKIGELAFQTVNFIDMMQTLEIVQHDDLYYETNLELTCQRCLEPMKEKESGHVLFVVLEDDSMAAAAPG